MKKFRWPILPDHVTEPDHSINNDSIYDSLNGIGVMPNDLLRGRLNTLSGRLLVPFDFIEFPVGQSKDPVITSIRLSRYLSCSVCVKIKDKTNCLACKNELIKISLIIHKLSKNHNTDLYENRLKNELKKHFLNRLYPVFVSKIDRRIIIEFDCNKSSFRILMIPVFFEGKLIGILVSCGIRLQRIKDIDAFKRHLSNSLKNAEIDMPHNKYLNRKEELIRNFIGDISDRIVKWYDDVGYFELKKYAIAELKNFETFIEREFLPKRKDIINKYINKKINVLNKIIADSSLPDTIKTSGIDMVWSVLGNMLKKFLEDFHVKSVLVFGSKSPLDSGHQILDMVYLAGQKPIRKYKNLHYDINDVLNNISKIKEFITHSPEVIVSSKYDYLFEGILPSVPIDKTCSLIRIFYSNLTPHSSFVLWTIYDHEKWNPLLKPNDKINIHLETQFRYFYLYFSRFVSAIFDFSSRNLVNNSLRIFKHEIGNVTNSLKASRDLFLDSTFTIRNLLKDEIEELAVHFNSCTTQIDFLIKKASSPIYVPSPKKRKFNLYEKVFEKWSTFLKRDLDYKDQKLIIQKDHDNANLNILADEILLEQLFYNLIDNARKYGYQGTKIYTKGKIEQKIDENKFYYKISVSNFGIEVQDLDRIFDIYYRTNNAQDEEGTGIGLFHCKQIVDAHGGFIKTESKKISKFNVLTFNSILTYQNEFREKNVLKEIIDEYQLFKEKYNLEDIVLMHSKGGQRFTPPKTSILLHKIYNKPTYKVTFNIFIPH